MKTTGCTFYCEAHWWCYFTTVFSSFPCLIFPPLFPPFKYFLTVLCVRLFFVTTVVYQWHWQILLGIVPCLSYWFENLKIKQVIYTLLICSFTCVSCAFLICWISQNFVNWFMDSFQWHYTNRIYRFEGFCLAFVKQFSSKFISGFGWLLFPCSCTCLRDFEVCA